MATSSQHKLDKLRTPRVHITYDLHIGNATEKKELPMVIGVFADLYGHNTAVAPLKERQFDKVIPGTFDQFVEKISPMLKFAVKDRSSADENARTQVELKFTSMADFSPDNFVKQHEVFGPLLAKRKLLTDVLAKIDGNDKLVAILLETLKDSGKVTELLAATKIAPEAA